MEEGGEEYRQAADSAWQQYQTDLKSVFDNPHVNLTLQRVAVARALARFWRRTEKVGMSLAAVEQKAFDDHIKPLRQVPQKPQS